MKKRAEEKARVIKNKWLDTPLEHEQRVARAAEAMLAMIVDRLSQLTNEIRESAESIQNARLEYKHDSEAEKKKAKK